MRSQCLLRACLQGFLQTALVVSSFHVLDVRAADGVVERTVRILYGEGDRYGCWLDVLADNIVWHAISSPGELAPGQPAPESQQVRRYPQYAPAGEPGAGGQDTSTSAIVLLSPGLFPCSQHRSGTRSMRLQERLLASPGAEDIETPV